MWVLAQHPPADQHNAMQLHLVGEFPCTCGTVNIAFFLGYETTVTAPAYSLFDIHQHHIPSKLSHLRPCSIREMIITNR
jgi:hypothetical protein